MPHQFTVTLGDDGTLMNVVSTNGEGVSQELKAPAPFPPGKTTAATGLGVVMTVENPTCCYWIQGGRAFKVCW
jgi:hypothetical protein